MGNATKEGAGRDEENRGTVCRCGTTGTLSGDLPRVPGAQQVRAERGVQRRGRGGEPAAALGLSPGSRREAQGALTPQSACRDVQGSSRSRWKPRALY